MITVIVEDKLTGFKFTATFDYESMPRSLMSSGYLQDRYLCSYMR